MKDEDIIFILVITIFALFIVIMVLSTIDINNKENNKSWCISQGGEYYQTYKTGFMAGAVDEEHCLFKENSKIIKDIVLQEQEKTQ